MNSKIKNKTASALKPIKRSIQYVIPKKRFEKPGTSPGVLIKREREEKVRAEIIFVQYSNEVYLEKKFDRLEECIPFFKPGFINWINVINPIEVEQFKKFGEVFNLHPLAMEDVVTSGQSPKLDQYAEHSFITFNRVTKNDSLHTDEIDIFYRKELLVTVIEHGGDPFEPIRKRIQLDSSRHRKSDVDYLLYTLIDLLVDEIFPALESVGTDIENIEEELLTSPTKETLLRINMIKRNLLVLRRTTWPERDVINNLMRSSDALITNQTKIYLKDVSDHILQIIDIIETYRELCSHMVDIYLSSVSNKMNEVMKVLTIIATIFIPLTFIAGVYGMNFKFMPELGWRYGYFLSLGFMLAVGGGMLYYFKRKKWFD